MKTAIRWITTTVETHNRKMLNCVYKKIKKKKKIVICDHTELVENVCVCVSACEANAAGTWH